MKEQLLKGEKLLEFSKKLFTKYKKDIINLIEETTKKKFKYQRFKFMMEKGIDYWTVKQNKILIGSESIKQTKKVLGSIIHELVHINTYNKLIKEYNIGNSNKIERWTVDKTNEIIKKINYKNKTNFKLQNYDK
jgi:hypothetical protein